MNFQWSLEEKDHNFIQYVHLGRKHFLNLRKINQYKNRTNLLGVKGHFKTSVHEHNELYCTMKLTLQYGSMKVALRRLIWGVEGC